MKLIDQSYEIITISWEPLLLIEQAGRTCYKSEELMSHHSSQEFAKKLIRRGHESVIEHASATVKFITNRGVTHELVRHRLAAYSQESTRYVNYGGKDMEFIRPVWFGQYDPENYSAQAADIRFERMCYVAESHYNELLNLGWSPQQAREVLPNALKTEIVMTANLREWRHVFKLRTSKAAHPQMRALMLDTLEGFKKVIPVVFDDIGE